MSKVYFIAEAKIGEDTLVTEPLNFIIDDNGKHLLKPIFNITEEADFEKHPDKNEFITTVFPMVEEYFADEGKIDYAIITAIDKNTHIFQWGIKVIRLDDEQITTSLIDWKANNRIVSLYEQYKVTNKVTEKKYTQWIEGFVRTVIYNAGIGCKELVIDDIEESKRIFLLVDGKEYTIRTWSFIPAEEDEKGHVCAETVSYTLYKTVKDETGSHGEKIFDETCSIDWEN